MDIVHNSMPGHVFHFHRRSSQVKFNFVVVNSRCLALLTPALSVRLIDFVWISLWVVLNARRGGMEVRRSRIRL
jgi:hypothetical protein